MTYPQEVDFWTGKNGKPLPPTIIEPITGQEVTNVNPILKIKWLKGEDQWYRHCRQLAGSWLAESPSLSESDTRNTSTIQMLRKYHKNPSLLMAIPYQIPANTPWGIVDCVRQLTLPHETGYGRMTGRIKNIIFEVMSNYLNGALQTGDITYKLYLNSSVTTSNGPEGRYSVTNIGTLAKEGVVEVDGTVCTVNFDYDEMIVRDQWFALIFETARNDIRIKNTEYMLYRISDDVIPSVKTMITQKNGSSWASMYAPSQPPGEISPTMPGFIYELYEGHYLDLAYEFQYTVDGSTWQPLQHHFFGAQTELYFDMTDIVDVTETSRAKIRVRVSDRNGEHYIDWDKSWTDNYSDWVESGNFYIFKHVAPLKPTNLFVSGTGVIDKNLVNRLSWKHVQQSMYNRQGRATLQWRVQGETEWNTVEIAGMNQYWDAPADTFPLETIEWRVMTYNTVDMAGPYSDIETFTVKDTPTAPTILAPLVDVEEPNPLVSWDHSYLQTHYQINVLTMLGNIIWTSGEVESGTTVSRIDKYLDNLTTYTLQVRIKNSDGLWSHYAEKTFSTDYKFPAPADVTVTPGDGFITISFENPPPSGEQPIVVRNEVYKKVDDEWVKISDAAYQTFRDYAAASGVLNEYKVRAIAENEVYTDSEPVSATVSIKGVVMYVVNDPEGTLRRFRLDGHGRGDDWQLDGAIMPYQGRKRPGIEIGEMQIEPIDFTLKIENMAEMAALDRIVKSRQIVCYRDGRGRVAHGVFLGRPRTDERWGGYTVNLSLTPLDYVEGDEV